MKPVSAAPSSSAQSPGGGDHESFDPDMLHGSSTPSDGPGTAANSGVTPAPGDPDRPPAAGGQNPRENQAPDGTTAAEIDALLPSSEHAATIAAQDAVREAAEEAGAPGSQEYRATLDEYYEQHPVHVDPETDTAYAASYDSTNGQLRLTRNDARLEAWAPPGGPANLSSGDSRINLDPPHRGIPLEADGTAPATPQPLTAFPFGNEPGNYLAEPEAKLGSASDSEYPEGIADVSIVVREDGSRTISGATTSAIAPAAGRVDITVAFSREVGNDGEVTSSRDERAAVQVVDGAVLRTSEIVTGGAQGAPTRSLVTSSASRGSDRWATSVQVDYGADGQPATAEHTTAATLDGIMSNERITTQYGSGTPIESQIDRSVTLPPQGGGAEPETYTENLELGYTDGEVTTLSGSNTNADGVTHTRHDRDDRLSYLDAVVARELGPAPEGTARFAFGVVVSPSDHDVDDAVIHAPGYVSRPGITYAVNGVPAFEEGGSLFGLRAAERRLQLQQISAPLPAELWQSAQRIDLLEGRSPFDVVTAAELDNPDFVSSAVAVQRGDSRIIQNWGLQAPLPLEAHTYFHELGHLAGDLGGAVDQDEWLEAAQADQALGRADDIASQIDVDAAEFLGDGRSVSGGLGVTSYANSALDSRSGEESAENEDWAEATRLYIQSQQQGGLVQVADPDGSTRVLQFADLYPNRAAILDAYYGLTTAS